MTQGGIMKTLIKTHIWWVGFAFVLTSCAHLPGREGHDTNAAETEPHNELSGNSTARAIPNMSDSPNTSNALPQRLSLQESIRIALANNRQLALSQERKNESRGYLVEAQSASYPHLKLSGSYTRVDEAAQFAMGAQTIAFGKVDNYKAELGLTQAIYAGGRIADGVDLAKLGIHYSEQDCDSWNELVTFLVSKTYYDLLLAQDTTETTRRSLEVAKAHLADVSKIHKQGMTADYDLLRAKVQVTNIGTAYLQSMNQVHLARTSFISILGLPLDNDGATLTLTDRLVYAPALTTNEEAVLTIAFQKRPELDQARTGERMKKKSLELARDEKLPTLPLFGNLGQSNPPEDILGGNGWDDYWNAGVIATWSVFDGGLIKGRITREESSLRQAEIGLHDMEEKVRLEVRQALINLKDAEELVKSQEENVTQAEEGLRLAQVGYEQGLRTQLEVLDSQMTLDSARKNMSSALYAHIMANIMLKKAMGVLRQE